MYVIFLPPAPLGWVRVPNAITNFQVYAWIDTYRDISTEMSYGWFFVHWPLKHVSIEKPHRFFYYFICSGEESGKCFIFAGWRMIIYFRNIQRFAFLRDICTVDGAEKRKTTSSRLILTVVCKSLFQLIDQLSSALFRQAINFIFLNTCVCTVDCKRKNIFILRSNVLHVNRGNFFKI